MAMSKSTRKKLAIFVIVVALPLYIVVAATIVSLFERPNVWVELLIYTVLGVLWAIPLRSIFLGVGK